MCNLKYDINELIYFYRNRRTGIEKRLVVAKGDRWTGTLGLAGPWEYHFIYKMDKQKGPLYSTDDYIQYPVINHKRKEYEKECVFIHICVCITGMLSCRAETNTTL